jgi:hypothetical protein
MAVKASIQDSATLRSLGPGEVTAYLRATGWKLHHSEPERFARYLKPGPESESFEVDAPLRSELGDYALRVGELLRTLAVVEGRSQLDILRDIRRSTVDTIRLAVQGTSVGDGRIALEGGARLFAHARDLMLAAACATLEKRPVFATRRPSRAMEYLRHVRLGPTEAGSYVVTVESPVAPQLQPALSPEEEEPPFERQVTLTLAHAVDETRRAVASALAVGDAQPFFDAVPRGVHANLCEALAGLLSGGDADSLSLQFGWSPGRAVPAHVPRQVDFTADAVPVLQEASRIFRERAPRADFELVGIPSELASDDPQKGGSATLTGVVDGVLRKVRVELEGADYAVALRAHGQRVPVACEGELVREGRTFFLRNPRQLRVREEG